MAKKGTLFGKPRGEVIKHPGAFGKKASSAGMSTGAYAKKVLAKGSKASPETKKQAGLAKSFTTMRSMKKSMHGSGPFSPAELKAGFKSLGKAGCTPYEPKHGQGTTNVEEM